MFVFSCSDGFDCCLDSFLLAVLYLVYIDLFVLKIVFVSIVFFSTCVAFAILVFGEPSTRFKHVLEWNYFTFLLLYYFLSRLMWKKEKTPVHTPEGA